MTTHPPSDRKVALAFLAHPDDAEIQCGGTLTRLRDKGWEVHIATATAGDCGSATLGPTEISDIRRKEGQAAAESIGATYHCLEELDLRVSYELRAIQKSLDLFREVAPSLVFTHPRIDYHNDHEQVHLLARAAAFGYAIPNGSELPLKEGSAVPHLYYTDPLESANPYTGATQEPTVYIDISEQIDQKSDMLACHASQREWLRSHHGMDEYLVSMREFSAKRGTAIGRDFAESFTQHRGHPFPQDDVLKKELNGIAK